MIVLLSGLRFVIVKSSDLQWLPNGSEMPIETNCRFLNNQRQALKVPELHPVNGEILLTKLRSGQVHFSHFPTLLY